MNFNFQCQTCSLGEGTPTAFPVGSDVVDKLLVFLLGPSPLVGAFFVTARFPHCYLLSPISLFSETPSKCRMRERPTLNTGWA